MLRFTINFVLIVLAGLLQSATWFSFLGIKPDLVMVLILAILITDHDWIDRFAFIIVGELMLQFAPSPDIYSLIFLVVMLISAVIFDRINLQRYMTLGAVTFLATIAMDVYSRMQWTAILTEAAYNLVLVILIYAILSATYGKKVHQ